MANDSDSDLSAGWTLIDSEPCENQDLLSNEAVKKHEETEVKLNDKVTTEGISNIDEMLLNKEKDDDSSAADDEDSCPTEETADAYGIGKLGERKKDSISEISTSSHISEGLYSDVEIAPTVRQYFHTRNAKLNKLLNILLALSVTASIALGIGHFIGWSSHCKHQKPLSSNQVLQLKHLQDELVICLEQQDISHVFEGDNKKGTKVCYKNTEDWKNKFKDLLEEIQGLQEIIEITQLELQSVNQGFPTGQCSLIDEYENYDLKWDIIVRQMEYLKFLKAVEVVRSQEEISNQKLTVMEKENSELKSLKEVSQDDKILEEVKLLAIEIKNLKVKLQEDDDNDEENRGLEKQIRILRKENLELKVKLEKEEEDDSDMEKQIRILSEENNELKNKLGEKTINNQSINQITDGVESSTSTEELKKSLMKLEKANKDLKEALLKAHLKHSHSACLTSVFSSPTSIHSNVDEKTEIKKDSDKNNEHDKTSLSKDVYLEISKRDNEVNDKVNKPEMWPSEKKESQKFGELSEIEVQEENIDSPEVFWKQNSKPSGILKQSDIFHDLENSTELVNAISDLVTFQLSHEKRSLTFEFDSHLNATRSVFHEVQKNLTEKLSYVENFTKSPVFTKFLNLSQKVARKMTAAIKDSVSKLHKISKKFINAKKPIASRVDKMLKRITDVADRLELRWVEINDKWIKSISAEEKGASNNKQRRKRNTENHKRWHKRQENHVKIPTEKSRNNDYNEIYMETIKKDYVKSAKLRKEYNTGYERDNFEKYLNSYSFQDKYKFREKQKNYDFKYNSQDKCILPKIMNAILNRKNSDLILNEKALYKRHKKEISTYDQNSFSKKFKSYVEKKIKK